MDEPKGMISDEEIDKLWAYYWEPPGTLDAAIPKFARTLLALAAERAAGIVHQWDGTHPDDIAAEIRRVLTGGKV